MNPMMVFYRLPSWLTQRAAAMVLGAAPWLLTVALTGSVGANEMPEISAEKFADEANSLWESGAISPALDVLEEGLQHHPQALALHRLRGDLLATFRDPRDAITEYETVLTRDPGALDVRWAKWSVLVRWGQGEESIAELRRIAEIDPRNPLIQLRLAEELRKADRLEESLDAYTTAVELVPDVLAWRLALARARFDLLDYQGAEADVRYVLQHLPPGAPLELPAKNQLSQLYESMERGRRFVPALTPDATASQLKEWASIRADAWRLFAESRFLEAEPLYRRVLALNPRDTVATHQLGLTLMQLGQCKEALNIFGSVLNLNPSEEDYADTVFRMGQCLVDLQQWEDAFIHFQILYDSALEFERNTKDVQLPEGTRVLDRTKIARWLAIVRPHVPELANQPGEDLARSTPSPEPADPAREEEELFARAIARTKPQQALESGAALMGRDADFSWFRFVIPAGKVIRDDFPTGAHEFIPLSPGDTFLSSQQEIFLVFGLVSASYDAVPLTARCVAETSETAGEPHVVAQDQAMTSMNDQSGYFLLSRPPGGWIPGLYRCGLFAGERTSAYTLVDETRFRIISARLSSASR
jgi:tetratricopeptide (TPR) repeat protein